MTKKRLIRNLTTPLGVEMRSKKINGHHINLTETGFDREFDKNNFFDQIRFIEKNTL